MVPFGAHVLRGRLGGTEICRLLGRAEQPKEALLTGS
jgi:hypothetical protein